MRVSTSQMYSAGVEGFNRQQENVSKLQQQLSTFKRVNQPSDDPVASARILDTRQAQNRNHQFITNSHTVDSALEFGDTALGAMNNLLIEMKTLAVYAGDAALSPQNLKQIGADMSKKMEQFASLLNTKDGQGRYMFSGTKAGTQPYIFKPVTEATTDAQIADTFKYQGNHEQKLVQTGSDRFIAISEPASAFLGTDSSETNPTNSLLFGMAKLTQQLLKGKLGPDQVEDPPSSGTFRDANAEESRKDLFNAISSFDEGIQSISTAQASMGARRLEAEQGRELGLDLELVYRKSIHVLEDLDIAQAASDLMMSRSALEASQLSFSKMQGLSLFNYM